MKFPVVEKESVGGESTRQRRLSAVRCKTRTTLVERLSFRGSSDSENVPVVGSHVRQCRSSGSRTDRRAVLPSKPTDPRR
jgi:hypothetical protein